MLSICSRRSRPRHSDFPFTDRSLRLIDTPPFKISIVDDVAEICMTRPLPFFQQVMSASFARHTHLCFILAREIILPTADRAKRGRLTRVANIPLEVSAMQPKDVNLIHLLVRCKQSQLARHLERVERLKKWRCSV